MPMVLGAAFLKDELSTDELIRELLSSVRDTLSLITMTEEDLTKCCQVVETI
jgi:hypothetical protein